MNHSNLNKTSKKKIWITILICFFISFYETLLHHLDIVNLTVFKLLLTKHTGALIDFTAATLGASFGLPLIFATLLCLFPRKNKSRKTVFTQTFIYISIGIAVFQLLRLITVLT